MLKIFLAFSFLLFLFGCSSTSSRNPASQKTVSGELDVSVDWDRIKNGIKTGDFSCKGTCAEISMDWYQVWRTMSGQDFRDRKKNNLSYCIKQYVESKKSVAAAEESLRVGEITVEEYKDSLKTDEDIIRIVDKRCSSELGTSEAENLKRSILNSETP